MPLISISLFSVCGCANSHPEIPAPAAAELAHIQEWLGTDAKPGQPPAILAITYIQGVRDDAMWYSRVLREDGLLTSPWSNGRSTTSGSRSWLTVEQLATVEKLLRQLPSSSAHPVNKVLLVSFRTEQGKWTTREYDPDHAPSIVERITAAMSKSPSQMLQELSAATTAPAASWAQRAFVEENEGARREILFDQQSPQVRRGHSALLLRITVIPDTPKISNRCDVYSDGLRLTSREVYNWASQGLQSKQLAADQVILLKKALQRLPAPQGLYGADTFVSCSDEAGHWLTRAYVNGSAQPGIAALLHAAGLALDGAPPMPQ